MSWLSPPEYYPFEKVRAGSPNHGKWVCVSAVARSNQEHTIHVTITCESVAKN